ncbi:2Fe-2S iron-sulfur cluster-binding protein [Vibrio ostreicida]|uniref:2Fe-2S iron-sulfur cluster-binding protein n=1 Tax=Vibrio ostreicida TaxID=526588 RepID=A0ABT8BUE4_9VIBR|nr:2Fe-2S iron-sulfur cluster-binding protein [Vibrio ostreicida]MDN3610787.1 2Fe-2S iron-sulfur cluster-binding protein [Vibrio ostreicida]NPD07222.1 2Fe-2S iron-sulfur cluster binding domain-containing protein [Vibrio ostreicida]
MTKFTITIDGEVVSQNANENTSLLATLEQEGYLLPRGCGIGCCGICKIKKLGGAISMCAKGGISDQDIEQGYILPCCSYPTSDVSIVRKR